MNDKLKVGLTLVSALTIFPLVYSLAHAETVVKTGNSSSSVSINNKVNNGTSKTEITTSGNAKAEVSTTINGKNTTVTSNNGETVVKTTNEKGETVTKTLEDGTEIKMENNQIKVMTDNGEKTVSVTTEQAVEALISTGTISQQTNVIVKSEGESVNYEITGYADKRFLGVIPVKLTRVITYSAKDRTVSSVYRSFITRVLDKLSF